MSSKNIFKSVTALAATAALAFTLSACGSSDGYEVSEGTKEDPIRIGVVGAEDYWPTFVTEAEKEGLFVEVVDLGQYTIPNKALSEGEIDVNQFQHLQFLGSYNEDAKDNLAPFAATAVYPLGLYSQKHESIDTISGGEIAVPNDPTNLTRALLLLQEGGLIELKDGGSSSSTELDVLPTSKVKIVPVDAAQTVISLPDVEASIVNNDFLADANLKASDAIYGDSADSEGARPYINIWVARDADKGNETLAKLVEIYKTDIIQEGVLAASDGTAAIANQTGAELEGYLKTIQEDIAAGN